MNSGFPDNNEPLARPDTLPEKLTLVQRAFNTAARDLKTRFGESNGRYNHLATITKGRTATLEDSAMTTKLLELGYDKEKATRVNAFYLGKQKGSVVDAVTLRKDTKITPLVLLHEFAHRASEIPSLQGRSIPYGERLDELLDFSPEAREKLMQENPVAYGKKLAYVDQAIHTFHEGLNQWATLYLAQRVPGFNPPSVGFAYENQVYAVLGAFRTAFLSRGFSLEQMKGFMLDLALTGDFSRVTAALPVKEEGFKKDFNVGILVNIANGNYIKLRNEQMQM